MLIREIILMESDNAGNLYSGLIDGGLELA